MHIPRNYIDKSSKRVIVMEYVEGIKINDVERLKQIYGS
jgi:predicted unusual protein kinase regulating ubiquinone biosynthesis (AarF/ABC1/UbiB family)